MKLDPRIMKRPFTPWDRKEFLQFIRSHDGKMTIPGYFANSFQVFCDLSNFADFDSAIGVLSAVMDIEYPFSPGKDKWYQFFLPDEWVKEPEKKYRPFSIEDWKLKHSIGETILYRYKGTYCGDHSEAELAYLGFIKPLDGITDEAGKGQIVLGNNAHDLQNLFDDYEMWVDGDWIPFGIETEEQE